jgi:VCBS repeat protein
VALRDGGTVAGTLIRDVNGDGRLDLVVDRQSTLVSVILGNGNGTFLPETTFAAGGPIGGPGALILADLT